MTRVAKPLSRALALALAAAALAGCVYEPPPAYGGYYSAPGYYYGPPVLGSLSLGFGGGWDHDWDHGWGRRHWR